MTCPRPSRLYSHFKLHAAPLALSLAFMTGCTPAPQAKKWKSILTPAVQKDCAESAAAPITYDSPAYRAMKRLILSHRYHPEQPALHDMLRTVRLEPEARDGLLAAMHEAELIDMDGLEILLAGYETQQGPDSTVCALIREHWLDSDWPHAYAAPTSGLYPAIVKVLDEDARDQLLDKLRTQNAYSMGIYLPLLAGYDTPVDIGTTRQAFLMALTREDMNGWERAVWKKTLKAVSLTPDACDQLLFFATHIGNEAVIYALREHDTRPENMAACAIASDASSRKIQILLDQGADPNATFGGKPALLLAAERIAAGDHDARNIMDMLLHGGADLKAALTCAVQEKSYSAFIILQTYENARAAIENARPAMRPAAPRP